MLNIKIPKVRVLFYAAVLFLCLSGIILALKRPLLPKRIILEVEEKKDAPRDRILVLAPHPDDEILGCAGVIQKAVKEKLAVKIVFLTYGDNNEWSFLVYRKHPVLTTKAVQAMGQVRFAEAHEAAKFLGLADDQLVFLGYPDYRTLEIWYSHWGERPAARGMFSRVKAVPYPNAFRPGAEYKADEILKDLSAIIEEFKPTRIYLSHPSDHNPDHRALYLFTRIALWDLKGKVRAKLYPYMVHYKHWPSPAGKHPEKKLVPPDFLKDTIIWQYLPLEAQEVKLKTEALKKHRSQYISSPGYLLSFVRANELFGEPEPMKLGRSIFRPDLLLEHHPGGAEYPEGLMEEERATFVGIQKETVSLEGEYMVFTISFSRPLSKTISASLYVFGYRSDIPFNRMPKIHIRFGTLSHKVLDQGKPMEAKLIKVKRHARKMVIKVPLEVLGDPQKVLTSARTYSFVLPLDWVSWRVVELEE